MVTVSAKISSRMKVWEKEALMVSGESSSRCQDLALGTAMSSGEPHGSWSR